MHNYLVTFDIKSDWVVGSGKEGGAYADSLCLKNNDGLPYIPGKSLKGLFREAFHSAANNEWFDREILSLLFGTENDSGLEQQGVIQISSANLSTEESHYIKSKNAAKHLYRVIQFTAINKTTGTAKKSSLRSMEVTVPMTLTAQIGINTAHPSYQKLDQRSQIDQHFAQWLTDASTLITEFGGKRHRGLGKVIVSVREAS